MSKSRDELPRHDATAANASRRDFCHGAALAFVGCSLGCGNGLYPAPSPGGTTADQGIPLADASLPGSGSGYEVVDGGTCASTQRIAVDGALPDVGMARLIGANGSSPPVYLCRDAGGLYALSAVCTHQGCTVGFQSANGGFQCPCHGSVFSFNGVVERGPATRSLVHYGVCLGGPGVAEIDVGTIVAPDDRVT